MHYKKEIGKRNEKASNRIFNNSMNSRMSIILFTMLLLLLFAGLVNAITGNGGTISLNSEIGSISYNTNTSGISAYGGSSTIYGIFSASSLDGRLGLLGESENITVNLTILTPANGTLITGAAAHFNYVPSGRIINCSLYIDGALKGINSNPIMDSMNSFTANSLSIGKHFWNINCSYGQYALTESREFTTITGSGFDSNSTNLTGINASAVPNLTLSKSAGKIVFDGYTDLSSGVDLSANIRISPRSIYINSAAAPMLNKPATLTLNDIPFGNVVIWRDGAVCNDCSVISLSNNKLVFSVTGFSDYTITSTSKLETYDDSDSTSVLQNQTLTFNANYTDIVSGAPITGSCNIVILGDGTYAMTYNATSLTYQYTASFADMGIKSYTVQCTPGEAGFDALELDSTFAISNVPPPSFADIQAQKGQSSSMNLNKGAAVVNSLASNTTELVFDTQTVTKTWQGYYGNVVGNVTLKDADSNSFYNWESVSPNGEVYATRSPTVTWENIRCANLAELQSENVLLGVNESAGDSITNTFRNTSNFNMFFTGNVKIDSSQNCYATHLNDMTGVQDTNYAEILLSDSTLMVYTALLDPGTIGFDGNEYDFEMLVGENGHNDDTTPTMYYFYIEIG
jgi:hypothetical protein